MNSRENLKNHLGEEWRKEGSIYKTNSNKDLFRNVTHQLTQQMSQQFESGDLRKKEISNAVGIKKNSRIGDSSDDGSFPITQNYSDRNLKSKYPPLSIINSNVDNGIGFESRINETKEELEDQIIDVEKRLTRVFENNTAYSEDFIKWQIEKSLKNFQQEQKNELNNTLKSIVKQLNDSLSQNSKRTKSIQIKTQENGEKINLLEKQFVEFMIEIEEKVEKVLNNNSKSDIASSIKKSLNCNKDNYAVELKNSINEIPSTSVVDELKTEMHEIQEQIKELKFELFQSKQSKKEVEGIETKQKDVMTPSIPFTEFESLKSSVSSLSQKSDQNFKSIFSSLQIQELNLQGMNETLGKVINIQILPRIKKIETSIQNQKENGKSNQDFLTQEQISTLCAIVKKELPTIKVLKTTKDHRIVEKLAQLPLPLPHLTYLLSPENSLIDIYGNYLLNDRNERITLGEEERYYLENVEGVLIEEIEGVARETS